MMISNDDIQIQLSDLKIALCNTIELINSLNIVKPHKRPTHTSCYTGSVLLFIDQCCAVGGSATNQELRLAFCTFNASRGVSIHPQTLSRVLRRLGYHPYASNGHRGWLGLHIKQCNQ
jgi:hypothetical protein